MPRVSKPRSRVRQQDQQADLDRGRGRQRRREDGVKMAWRIYTWAHNAIFTSSLTSTSSI